MSEFKSPMDWAPNMYSAVIAVLALAEQLSVAFTVTPTTPETVRESGEFDDPRAAAYMVSLLANGGDVEYYDIDSGDAHLGRVAVCFDDTHEIQRVYYWH